MKNIEQFEPYQQAKMAMQMENMGRQLAYALIQLLSIRQSMALAPLLGQKLGLSNQVAMENWVVAQLKNLEGMTADDLLIYLASAFERRMNELNLY